jgi:hypothetical protein
MSRWFILAQAGNSGSSPFSNIEHAVHGKMIVALVIRFASWTLVLKALTYCSTLPNWFLFMSRPKGLCYYDMSRIVAVTHDNCFDGVKGFVSVRPLPVAAEQVAEYLFADNSH